MSWLRAILAVFVSLAFVSQPASVSALGSGPAAATLGLDGAETPILRSVVYDADRRMTRSEYGPSAGAGFPLVNEMAYDACK